LRLNDVDGILISLKSLGINDSDELVKEICTLNSCLHNIVQDFQTSLSNNERKSITGAIKELKEIIKDSIAAADQTLEKCERQAYAIRDQRNRIDKIEELIKHSPVSKDIAEEIAMMRQELDSMQISNHEVIMTQAFHDLSNQAVNNVINLMQGIENQIVALTLACDENSDIQDNIEVVSLRSIPKVSQVEVDTLLKE
jgi:chemotaxis regulatin CheY-phosphate phosphatase CheZ